MHLCYIPGETNRETYLSSNHAISGNMLSPLLQIILKAREHRRKGGFMTDNTIQIFQGHEVEVFELNGVVLFNPYHVGICLDIADVKSSIRNFNDKQVVKVKNSDVRTMHIRKLNNAGENFLTESGVYKLIFRSRKPNAEAFTDWVTDEVLPSIRKTGKYEQPQPESRELVMAKGLIAANEMIQEQKQTIADQQLLIEQQQDRIEDLEETEKDWKLLMDAEGSFSINQLSQFINIGEYKLFKYLRDFKLLFKNENNDNVPYRKYLQTGKFMVVPAVAPNGVTHSQTRVLPEGIPVITNLLRKNAVLA